MKQRGGANSRCEGSKEVLSCSIRIKKKSIFTSVNLVVLGEDNKRVAYFFQERHVSHSFAYMANYTVLDDRCAA